MREVYEVAKQHGVPIMGQGGISNASDAIEFFLAGSSTIGIGTALFFDPLVCEKINLGISKYLEENGLPAVGSLVGLLKEKK